MQVQDTKLEEMIHNFVHEIRVPDHVASEVFSTNDGVEELQIPDHVASVEELQIPDQQVEEMINSFVSSVGETDDSFEADDDTKFLFGPRKTWIRQSVWKVHQFLVQHPVLTIILALVLIAIVSLVANFCLDESHTNFMNELWKKELKLLVDEGKKYCSRRAKTFLFDNFSDELKLAIRELLVMRCDDYKKLTIEFVNRCLNNN